MSFSLVKKRTFYSLNGPDGRWGEDGSIARDALPTFLSVCRPCWKTCLVARKRADVLVMAGLFRRSAWVILLGAASYYAHRYAEARRKVDLLAGSAYAPVGEADAGPLKRKIKVPTHKFAESEGAIIMQPRTPYQLWKAVRSQPELDARNSSVLSGNGTHGLAVGLPLTHEGWKQVSRDERAQFEQASQAEYEAFAAAGGKIPKSKIKIFNVFLHLKNTERSGLLISCCGITKSMLP